MGNSELVDIDCRIVEEREKAIAIVDGTQEEWQGVERDKWFWLPRSKIEIELVSHSKAVVTVPRWLAEEKGLV